MTTFKPPKPRVLEDDETITSFASWQSNILYHLSLNNPFADFIEPDAVWQKKSITNRGLADDAVDKLARRSAAQNNVRKYAGFDCPVLTISSAKRYH